MSEENNESKKQVSKEFVNTVKKYIEIDDKLKYIKKQLKVLNGDKKEHENYILDYLQSIEENIIDIPDGKLKRNINKTQSPLKKEFIQKVLAEIIGDSNKATLIMEEINNSRPMVERISLKRIMNKND
jgi:hypothetical protein